MTDVLKKPLLSREDIRSMLAPNMTKRWVGRNERNLGIHVARVDINRRCVMYRTLQVIRIFKAKGLIE